MTFDFRLAENNDIDAYFAQLGRSFHRNISSAEASAMAASMDLQRTRVATDGAQLVGTLRSWPTQFTVPGPATVSASALTNVTVAATHRRQGILTNMIMGDLRDSADRGELMSILIASEYPIYGRFGYGPAIANAGYRIETTGLTSTATPEGRVEIVDLATLRVDGPKVYETFRVGQPGSIERSAAWWDRTTHHVEIPGAEPFKGFCARYIAPNGDVEGYVMCDGKMDAPDMRHRGVLNVQELITTSPRAYRALWNFCVNVDLLSTVSASNRAVDEPLGLLFDNARAVHQTHVHDFVWIRILDVVGALEARTYNSAGRLVLDVVDEMGFANGRYLLDTSTEGSSCRTTTQTPDITLNASALGAIYAGDVAPSTLATAGLVETDSPRALRVADSIFHSPTRSWCATWF